MLADKTSTVLSQDRAPSFDPFPFDLRIHRRETNMKILQFVVGSKFDNPTFKLVHMYTLPIYSEKPCGR